MKKIIFTSFCLSMLMAQTAFSSTTLGKINLQTVDGENSHVLSASKVEDQVLYDGGVPYNTKVIVSPRVTVNGSKYTIGIGGDVEEYICNKFFNKKYSRAARGDIFIWNNLYAYYNITKLSTNLFLANEENDFDGMGGSQTPIIDRIFCADQEINIGE